MNNNYSEFITKIGDGRVVQNEELSKYSSFRMGGPADLFFKAKNRDDLYKSYTLARTLKIPVFMMSGGTNLLISDKAVMPFLYSGLRLDFHPYVTWLDLYLEAGVETWFYKCDFFEAKTAFFIWSVGLAFDYNERDSTSEMREITKKKK